MLAEGRPEAPFVFLVDIAIIVGYVRIRIMVSGEGHEIYDHRSRASVAREQYD
jgi:hypothetical protein